jgi:membrane protease subunit HflK
MNAAAPPRHSQGLILRAILQTIRTTTVLMRWLVPVLLLLYLFSGVTRVQPDETGLRYRFGRLHGQPCPPGLAWAWPAPFERIVALPTARELELELADWKDLPAPSASETAQNLMRDAADSLHPVRDGYTLTGDANVIRGEFLVRYRITDPVRHRSLGDDPARFIRSVFLAALTRVLAGESIDEATTAEREATRLRAQGFAQADADRLGLGVTFTGVELRQLGPPSHVMAAFEEVTSAQLVARTLLEDARAYRAEQLPRTAAEDRIIRGQADAWAEEQRLKARGEAAAFAAMLAEYRKAPDLIRARLFADSTAVVVDKANTSVLIPAGPDGAATLMIEPQAQPEP